MNRGARRAYAVLCCFNGKPSVGLISLISRMARHLLYATATERKLDDDGSDDDENPEACSGNLSRGLWKATCVRAALSVRSVFFGASLKLINFQPNLSDHERLFFASLAPTQETATILKSASRTWEDHLWTEISVTCEEKASRELSRLTSGSFWEGGIDAVEKGVQNISKVQIQQEEEAWKKEVLASLDNLKSVSVVDGCVLLFHLESAWNLVSYRQPANHPYHFSQLLIILDKCDLLLQSFADRLQSDVYQTESFEYVLYASNLPFLTSFL